MKGRRKLTYVFHNPNSEEATLDYILKVFIEANERKVKTAIQAAAGTFSDTGDESTCCEGHPA